jgi:SHS2 domain-containing protein
LPEADSYLSSKTIANTDRIGGFSVPKSGYAFLPHTTDAYIEAVGATLEEAMQFAGMALTDTMCAIGSISPLLTDRIEASGHDEITLLYDWLESILLRFDLDSKVYSRYKVAPLARSTGGLRASADVSGEKYDRQKHGSKVEVKAVTYHKMEVVREGGSTIVRFILDL